MRGQRDNKLYKSSGQTKNGYLFDVVPPPCWRNLRGVEKKDRVKTSVRMFKEAAEVGSRLRQIRARLDLSQSSAALELCISRERLANYEDGRTPLKVEVGLDACTTFIMSEKWLATGEGDPRMSMNLRGDPIARTVKAGSFFATAYKEVLAPRYQQRWEENPFQIRFGNFGSSIFYDRLVMQEFVATWFFLLQGGRMEELMHKLVETGEQFCSESIRPAHYEHIVTDHKSALAGSEQAAFVNPTIKICLQ